MMEKGGPFGPRVRVRRRVIGSEGGRAGVELLLLLLFDWGRGREGEWVVVEVREEFVLVAEEEEAVVVVVEE